jgi:hypothetical protein
MVARFWWVSHVKIAFRQGAQGPVFASKIARTFAAASRNSTRNATILFARIDPSDGMKKLLATLFLAVSVWAQTPAGAAAAAPSAPPAVSKPAGAGDSAIPVDQENARKAKALLDQGIKALGGEAYLAVRDMQQSGRTFSFHHGRPTSNGVVYWRFMQYPDKDRIEITKERDIAQVYTGDKGFEITYKGAHAMEEKDLSEYLRRRRFSLETVLRQWVSDPGVALFYEGNAVAAQHPALQVSLINAKNEGVTLYFDADTHLPVKKTFVWRDPVDKQRNTEEEIYDNYRVVQGIMTPYGVARYFNGDIAGQRFLNSASYNQGLDPAMFDPNSGYNPNKPSGKH